MVPPPPHTPRGFGLTAADKISKLIKCYREMTSRGELPDSYGDRFSC